MAGDLVQIYAILWAVANISGMMFLITVPSDRLKQFSGMKDLTLAWSEKILLLIGIMF